MYFDGPLIWGLTQQAHDIRLKATLQVAQQAVLTFNAEKCNLSRTEVTFLADVISPKGINPSRALISSLLNMPASEDKKAVQRVRD